MWELEIGRGPHRGPDGISHGGGKDRREGGNAGQTLLCHKHCVRCLTRSLPRGLSRLHHTDRETEAQRGKATCPQSLSNEGVPCLPDCLVQDQAEWGRPAGRDQSRSRTGWGGGAGGGGECGWGGGSGGGGENTSRMVRRQRELVSGSGFCFLDQTDLLSNSSCAHCWNLAGRGNTSSIPTPHVAPPPPAALRGGPHGSSCLWLPGELSPRRG